MLEVKLFEKITCICDSCMNVSCGCQREPPGPESQLNSTGTQTVIERKLQTWALTSSWLGCSRCSAVYAPDDKWGKLGRLTTWESLMLSVSSSSCSGGAQHGVILKMKVIFVCLVSYSIVFTVFILFVHNETHLNVSVSVQSASNQPKQSGWVWSCVFNEGFVIYKLHQFSAGSSVHI